MCFAILTEPSDQSTDNKLSKSVGCALKDGTDTHNKRTDKDSLPTTQNVTDPDCRNRASETSQVVRCDRDTLSG